MLNFNNPNNEYLILVIAKFIQFVFYYFIFKEFKEYTKVIFFVSLLPTSFVFSLVVGRSTFDVTLVILLAIFSFKNKFKYLLLILLMVFHKYLILLVSMGYLITGKIKKKFISIFIISCFFIIAYLNLPQLTNLINLTIISNEVSNFPLKPLVYPNIFNYFIRGIVTIIPPIFYFQSPLIFIFSLNHFIAYYYIFIYRKFLDISDSIIPFLFILFLNPLSHNLIQTTRWANLLLIYIVISLIMRDKNNKRSNNSSKLKV